MEVVSVVLGYLEIVTGYENYVEDHKTSLRATLSLLLTLSQNSVATISECEFVFYFYVVSACTELFMLFLHALSYIKCACLSG